MLSRSTASQVVKLGGNKWFFIVADYVFGQQLERDAAAFVRSSGGTVVGRAAYPFPETTDFSSYLLQAQASGANVIGFASAGNDTVNGVKQAHEFGLGRTMQMAALLAHATDVDAIGPELAQGLYLTGTFYWDLNDATRAFTAKVLPRMPQRHPPNMIQAGCYAGTLHYLKAVAAMGAARARDGAAVVAQMKATPTDDPVFGSRHDPGGRAGAVPGLLVPGAQAGGREGAVGPDGPRRDEPGERGVAAVVRRRLQPRARVMGPEAAYRAHLAEGRFMIQRSRSTGVHVFYPRIAAPGSGETDLEWVAASGGATVYAITVNRSREGSHNVALVDLDEGPRMMTRIAGWRRCRSGRG